MSIYANRATHDHKGDHITWSVDDVEFAPFEFVKNSGKSFKFNYVMPKGVTYGDLRAEVRSALQGLAAMKRTLAICISGKDSEIIAREAADLGIPAKLYFLKIGNVNADHVAAVQKIAMDTGLKLTIVDLPDDKIEAVAEESFRLMNVYYPTYLLLPFLFKAIPATEFIVVGEGDLDKQHPHYDDFFKQPGIPMVGSEIAYRVWAQANARDGEFYFFSSTPGLILSAYNDPRLVRTPSSISTSELVSAIWPNLTFKGKTGNWDSNFARNTAIRDKLYSLPVVHSKYFSAVVPDASVRR